MVTVPGFEAVELPSGTLVIGRRSLITVDDANLRALVRALADQPVAARAGLVESLCDAHGISVDQWEAFVSALRDGTKSETPSVISAVDVVLDAPALLGHNADAEAVLNGAGTVRTLDDHAPDDADDSRLQVVFQQQRDPTRLASIDWAKPTVYAYLAGMDLHVEPMWWPASGRPCHACVAAFTDGTTTASALSNLHRALSKRGIPTCAVSHFDVVAAYHFVARLVVRSLQGTFDSHHPLRMLHRLNLLSGAPRADLVATRIDCPCDAPPALVASSFPALS